MTRLDFFCLIVSRLFQVKCLACGHVSERGEKYRDLLLQVAGQEDLVRRKPFQDSQNARVTFLVFSIELTLVCFSMIQ